MCSCLTLFGQYTEVINSNRPGASQGAFAVGNQVLQLETGFTKGWEKHELLQTETNAFTIDYALRYGLIWEQLEISINGSFLSESVIDNRSATAFEYDQSNFKFNTLGAKYLIYDPYKKRALEKPNLYSWNANNKFRWRELIPAVSFYAGVNFDTKDNPFLPPNDPTISPKFVVMTQNNMQGGWVFVTNIIVDRVTSEFPSYSYILTLTHAFNPKFSMFIENQGIKSDFYADQILRFGGAHLFGKDFQIDVMASTNFKDTPSKFYIGAGVSYRLDMHSKDQVIEESNKRNKGNDGESGKKRKDDFIDLENDGK
ncbi:transporter [uncultured Planktosalinus sp.]|uniref:transporter n=1 Tax=uncultured Planktosalinus sp. TaxID=1810935 RepID=UPI0030D6E48E